MTVNCFFRQERHWKKFLRSCLASRKVQLGKGRRVSALGNKKLPPSCKKNYTFRRKNVDLSPVLQFRCSASTRKRRSSIGHLPGVGTHSDRSVRASVQRERRGSQQPLYHSSICPIMEAAFLPKQLVFRSFPPNVLYLVCNHLVVPWLFISAGRADGLSCPHWFTCPTPLPRQTTAPLPPNPSVLDLVLPFI